jgi:hypothetical protein
MSHHVFAILGASNVTKALPSVLKAIIRKRRNDDSLAIFVAHGPGRSYGQTHGIVGWQWPGHRVSRLTDAIKTHLDADKPESLHVLMTDIGNDIPYGVSVEELTGWVESLTHDFQALGSRVAITSLPVESVLSLPAWKFNIVRPLLFPFHPLTRNEAFDRVRRVQARIEQIGVDTGTVVLPTRASWYGADHFHLRWKMHFPVFSAWIDGLLESATQDECDRRAWDTRAEQLGSTVDGKSRLSSWIRFGRAFEEHRFGVFRETAQPGREIASGVKLYLY